MRPLRVEIERNGERFWVTKRETWKNDNAKEIMEYSKALVERMASED